MTAQPDPGREENEIGLQRELAPSDLYLRDNAPFRNARQGTSVNPTWPTRGDPESCIFTPATHGRAPASTETMAQSSTVNKVWFSSKSFSQSDFTPSFLNVYHHQESYFCLSISGKWLPAEQAGENPHKSETSVGHMQPPWPALGPLNSLQS